ncbi:hypothetical protein BC628DRAFT_1048255 [Trametes gibbosa]|nr:hypothetical protein BC628DRAFT_1048255 [Trametes gibbosa]
MRSIWKVIARMLSCSQVVVSTAAERTEREPPTRPSAGGSLARSPLRWRLTPPIRLSLCNYRNYVQTWSRPPAGRLRPTIPRSPTRREEEVSASPPCPVSRRAYAVDILAVRGWDVLQIPFHRFIGCARACLPSKARARGQRAGCQFVLPIQRFCHSVRASEWVAVSERGAEVPGVRDGACLDGHSCSHTVAC